MKIIRIVLALLFVFQVNIMICSGQGSQQENVHIVQPGDTFNKIATKYKIPLNTLIELNPHIQNYRKIYKGDKIILTPGTKLEEPRSEAGNNNTANTSEFSSQIKNKFYEGKRYTVVEFDPRDYQVELFNEMKNGRDFYDFYSIDKEKRQQGNELLFAMNAGMFHENQKPVGLLVTEGIVKKELNTGDGKGNFYNLLPNGVFGLTREDQPFILTTGEYRKRELRPRIATQSGPMLVIKGSINENFTPGSSNVNIRNGVGVTRKGKVVFIISDDPVNFYEFSSLFKDEYGCDNALYLDGFVSQWFSPLYGSSSRQRTLLGPIVTISTKK